MALDEPNNLLNPTREETPEGQIVGTLRERGAASAAEIGRLTGLAKSTVSTLVAQLKESGVIVDAGRQSPPRGNGRGRPATALMLNPAVGTCVGVFLGPTFVELAIADVSHAILDRRGTSLPTDYSVKRGVEAVQQLLTDAYDETGLPQDRLLGAGIAFPGPVDPHTGCVLRSSLVPTWAGTDIRQVFGNIFNVPIFADNESNCAAIAEMTWGAAQNEADFLYVKLDVGVGGAVVVNHSIVRGAAGGAGEIGHMSIQRDGPLCRCGNRGCFELYAGWDAIIAPAKSLLGEEVTFMDIVTKAENGDPGCQRLLSEAAETAGRGLAAAGAVLNPPLIVLGGRQILAGQKFIDTVAASYEHHAQVKNAAVPVGSQTRFVAGGFTNNTDAVLGAIGLVLRSHGHLV